LNCADIKGEILPFLSALDIKKCCGKNYKTIT
jgi:hypothetical protein